MTQFLLNFKWFRNFVADVWDDGFDKGESWDSSGGIDMVPPTNPWRNW